MSSKITTDLEVDDALVQDADYRFDEADRQYIDDQARGVEQHLVDGLIRGKHATYIRVVGSSAALQPGDVVALASVEELEPKVTLATTSALLYSVTAFGVVVRAASPGAFALVAVGGVLPPSITGLASGAKGFVRVNASTGRCERVASFSEGDHGIGVVDNAGYMQVVPGISTGGTIVVGGSPPFYLGTGTYPTTGELARAGTSYTNTDILTWKSATNGAIPIINVTDDGSYSYVKMGSSALASFEQRADNFLFFATGATSSAGWTFSGSNDGAFSVATVKQVSIEPTSTSWSGGSGGFLVKSNWGLGVPTLGTVDWQGGLSVGAIGNAMSEPSAAPPGNTYVYVYGIDSGIKCWFHDGAITFDRGQKFTGGFSGRYAHSTRAGGLPSPSAGERSYFGANGTFDRRMYFAEYQTAAASTTPALEYEMADETSVSFEYVVQMSRRTNVTKAGTYRGTATYRRTSAGAPTLVGSAVYDTDQETTAGDGVAFGVSGNKIQVNVTSADTDGRNWGVELIVREVSAA